MLPSRRLRRATKPRLRYVLEFAQPISEEQALKAKAHFAAWIKARASQPLLTYGAAVKEFRP